MPNWTNLSLESLSGQRQVRIDRFDSEPMLLVKAPDIVTANQSREGLVS